MIIRENVTGNEAQAKPLIVGVSTVYVHDNIEKVTEPDLVTGEIPEDLYTYRETQYTKDEYIEYLSDANNELGETVNSILTEIIPEMLEGGF